MKMKAPYTDIFKKHNKFRGKLFVLEIVFPLKQIHMYLHVSISVAFFLQNC